MCGVNGEVRRQGDVAPDLYVACIKNQHRAHDTSGIVTYDGNEYHLRRGKGEVANVFSRKSLARLKGSSGIGHVRWTTVGDINLQNAHPIRGIFRGKSFYIGHNGQLTDQAALKSRFAYYRRDVTTDTKFIAALITSSQTLDFEDALQYACSVLKGTYSMVVLYGDTVYAIRDSTGNRPLVLGKSKDALVVSSETVSFNPLDVEYVDEVHPGEIVALRRETMDFEHIPIKTVPSEMLIGLKFCLFEMIYILHPASIFLGRTVELVRERMGRLLYEAHPLDADIVFGVPDSGLAGARGYAKASGIPEEYGIIRSHYSGRVFIDPVAERTQKHRIKHDVVRELVLGKKVCVVDDSIIEGATSKKIVTLLKQNGAEKVYLLSCAPQAMNACHYGVATGPEHRRLIAKDHGGDIEAIRKELGADALGYGSVTDTIRAVIDTKPVIKDYPQLSDHNFCVACFTGQYPIPIDR